MANLPGAAHPASPCCPQNSSWAGQTHRKALSREVEPVPGSGFPAPHRQKHAPTYKHTGRPSTGMCLHMQVTAPPAPATAEPWLPAGRGSRASTVTEVGPSPACPQGRQHSPGTPVDRGQPATCWLGTASLQRLRCASLGWGSCSAWIDRSHGQERRRLWGPGSQGLRPVQVWVPSSRWGLCPPAAQLPPHSHCRLSPAPPQAQPEPRTIGSGPDTRCSVD